MIGPLNVHGDDGCDSACAAKFTGGCHSRDGGCDSGCKDSKEGSELLFF